METKMKVSEVAKKMSCSTATIYRWIKEGLLEATRLPTGSLLITEGQLSDFFEKHKEITKE